MCELLWSDPDEVADWESNPRGAGVVFGTGLVDKFLQMNNMNFVVRAHQLIMEGYKIHFNGKLMVNCLLFGPHQIIVIDVIILLLL